MFVGCFVGLGMKDLLDYVLVLLASFVFTTLIAMFINWEVDVSKFSVEARVGVVLFTFCHSIFVGLIVVSIKDRKRDE